jgi:hypothetical protein
MVKAPKANEKPGRQHDVMLARFIEALSERFDRETRRTLARTIDAESEFRADAVVIGFCAQFLLSTERAKHSPRNHFWAKFFESSMANPVAVFVTLTE